MYLPCVLLCINIVFYFKCFCFQIVFAKGAHYAIKKLSETQYDVIALDWTVNRKQARYDMATHVQILSTFCVDFVVVVGSRFFFMESSRCLLKADTISHEKVNSFWQYQFFPVEIWVIYFVFVNFVLFICREITIQSLFPFRTLWKHLKTFDFWLFSGVIKFFHEIKWPLLPFYTPWKHQKTFGLLVFSGVIQW